MSQAKDAKEDGRTRNGRATHERLYRAAVEVCVARGYESATMEEIATRAGVARRTAFNHFPAKADIAAEWAVRRGERALGLVREAEGPARPAEDRVRAYFHELALMTEHDWEETRQMTTGWLRGFGVPHHRSWLAGDLRTWLRDLLAGRPGDAASQDRPDPALVTDVLYDVLQGVLLRWLPQQAPEKGAFTAEADAAIALVLAGLRP